MNRVEPAAGTIRAAPRWRAIVDACAADAGPLPSRLPPLWRHELDDVQARVELLERSALAPIAHGDVVDGRDGVHALVALAGARLGGMWERERLIDVACAVELAYRATLWHEEVRDRGLSSGADNRRHVLDGDWSITQAAVLVADLGPVAYRLLVRGYGAAQLARLQLADVSSRIALIPTAVALGALVADAPAGAAWAAWAVANDGSLVPPGSAAGIAGRICRWARSVMGETDCRARSARAPTVGT